MKRHYSKCSARGFTLVEVMLSCTVLAILLSIVTVVITQTSNTVRSATAKVDAFQGARTAFDTITQKISQATLNTYWDYDNVAAPTQYIRKSDLHFLVKNNGAYGQQIFMQTPEAFSAYTAYDQAQGLLNACGFYVSFGPDTNTSPSWHKPDAVKKALSRYRLMQALQPAEDLTVYSTTDDSWTAAVRTSEWPLATNVIALVICPASSRFDTGGIPLSTDYQYDSRNGSAIQVAQLPPVIRVTMVAIDERTSIRLDSGATPPELIEDALNDKFQTVSQYEKDLSDLTTKLSAANIHFEVMSTSIPMRESKWSK